MERSKYKPPAYLLPTRKSLQPFYTWCIDTITSLQPPSPSGGRFLVVCVCAFSKWVECGILEALTSQHVTDWFHANIVCRFGTPAIVRTDRGKEYLGSFARYLRMKGIQQATISTAHPRANGLVERYNGCIKAGFRRLKVACP